jgi:putative acetyltransferase
MAKCALESSAGLTAPPCLLPFDEQRDAVAVRELFETVNRSLARPGMEDAFEAYIARSRAAEIDRIAAYYAEHDGAFWVLRDGDGDHALVGTFGLERAAADACELRRMYVAPAARRRGLARFMLEQAERFAVERGFSRMVLSTSELQMAALALYQNAGYRLVREEAGEGPSHKVLGGLRRFHLEKALSGAGEGRGAEARGDR